MRMDVILGVGIVGSALRELFEENGVECFGVDIKKENSFGKPSNSVELMHVCFPYHKDFVIELKRAWIYFKPKAIIIHSTVPPGTTKKTYLTLQNPVEMVSVVYSPIRGVHWRMVDDLKRYTKFYGWYGSNHYFLNRFQDQCGLKMKPVSSPLVLELAKILVDTSYYGWQIIFGQLVDKACLEFKVSYEEVWKFAEEIHEQLGNRWEPYVDKEGIQGHCVLPNLDLVEDVLPELKLIVSMINNETKKRYEKRR